MLQGLGDKGLQNSLIKEDKSFNNALGFAVFDSTINRLLIDEINAIKKDSANSVGSVPADIAEGIEGKNVTSHCLQFYNSARLAQAAKKEKKAWKRIPNIMAEIHKKLPTY